MKLWFKKHFEAALLLIASKILSRNVERSPVITRRDNDKIFEMEHDLAAIAERIKNDYR